MIKAWQAEEIMKASENKPMRDYHTIDATIRAFASVGKTSARFKYIELDMSTLETLRDNGFMVVGEIGYPDFTVKWGEEE